MGSTPSWRGFHPEGVFAAAAKERSKGGGVGNPSQEEGASQPMDGACFSVGRVGPAPQ